MVTPANSGNPSGKGSGSHFFGALLLITLYLISAFKVHAQNLPSGFNQVLVTNGISNPTVMAFAPDGRIFVAQQNGQLRIIKNGALLPHAFISLNVNSSGERGLLGIAFDPNFNSNKFIYLYYTLSSAANNRISRFTAGFGANMDTVMPNSEVVVLNLDPLSSANNHNGGTMQFGPDGKLYVGIGENANSANAQNLDTYLGKILRINSDGSVPAGNPFTSGSAQRQRVWEYGMRNPFTLTVQPGTGRIFVNDVGQSTWEEINDCTTGGKNYGWPTAEGTSNNAAFTNPVYAYPHGSGIGNGCAITGGAFFNPPSSNYPAQYTGRYFFLDLCNNWIDMLTFSGNTATRSNFASNIPGSPLGITTGPDGNLYFLSRNNSAVYKIIYTLSNAPIITQQPQSITVAQGNSATFSVTATGTAPLNYQWKKGTTSVGANASSYTIPSVTQNDAGTYSVIVSNGTGTVTSNGATLTVTVPNQPPTATINTPAAGATYAGGSAISFSGSATDPNQTIPASGFQWFVIFHHDAHTHPGPTAPDSVTSGSFTIPNSGETSANVFFRLYLVVTDAQGARDTAFTDILPRTSTITLNTNPPGLQVTLDGQPFTAPYTVTSVEGILRTIGVTSPQTFNNITYTFSSWSHGGAQSQTIATPVNDVVYTANLSPSTNLRNPENPPSTVNGIDFKFYQGSWTALPDFATLTPTVTGTVANFDITPRTTNDNFAFHFTGYVSVPTDGIYTFNTSSDDGSKLYIGTTLVVNNDGNHSSRERTGQIGLKAGKHAITVDYYEGTGNQSLAVTYSGPNIAKQTIPNTALYRVPITQSNTFTPVADAYVNSGSAANTNFGAATPLLIKKTNATELQREVYLRFDISSFSSSITSAKLRIYGSLNSTENPSVPVEVHNVTDITWAENAITWNNKPVAQATIIATTTVTGTTKQYYEWDLTQHIKTLRSAGINFVSLKLVNTNVTGGRIEFNSKEAAANKPQLVIVPAGGTAAKNEDALSTTTNTVDAFSVNLYPNPAQDHINVEITGDIHNGVLQLYDMNGKLIRENQFSDNNSIQTINTVDLGSGVYILSVKNGTAAVITRRLVIER